MPASVFSGPDYKPTEGHGLFRMLRRRILISIIAPVTWVSLVLLYFGFWASGFTVFQDIVVVLVSLLILVATFIGTWVSFGLHVEDM